MLRVYQFIQVEFDFSAHVFSLLKIRLMKPTLPLHPLIGLWLTSCKKDPVEVPLAETPVTKTITFNVYASKDYSDAFYDNALAEVHLEIGKISLKDNSIKTVWDTTYSFRQFKQYPQAAQMIRIEKAVPHFENSELLRVGKVVRYNVGGSPSMEASGEDLHWFEKTKLVTVSF